MVDIIEKHLKNIKVEYYSEMSTSKIEQRWKLDLSTLSNNDNTPKRFDFVVYRSSFEK